MFFPPDTNIEASLFGKSWTIIIIYGTSDDINNDMSLVSVYLKDVVTGTRQKYFLLEKYYGENVRVPELYIANIERNETELSDLTATDAEVSSQSDLTNISDSVDWTKKILLHNMYSVDSEYTSLSSRQYAFAADGKYSKSSPSGYSDSFAIRKPSIYTNNIASIGDYMYTLASKSEEIVEYPVELVKHTDSEDIVSSCEIFKEPVRTMIYKSCEQLQNPSTDSTFDQTSCFLDGIQYNQIREYPMTNNAMLSGKTLLATQTIAKNHLGYDYSQHYVENSSPQSQSNDIYELRDYKRMFKCGGKLYAVYTNSLSATKDSGPDIDNIVTMRVSKYDASVSSTSDIPISSQVVSPYATGSIEKIEEINSIGRFSSANGKGTSYYSIEVDNLGLNEKESVPELSSLVGKIKKSVVNGIRKLCERIEPANSQLFDVYFTGK